MATGDNVVLGKLNESGLETRINKTTSGYALRVTAKKGEAIVSATSAGIGLSGWGTTEGMFGVGEIGVHGSGETGVQGTSDVVGGFGVQGSAHDGIGVDGHSMNDVGVRGRGDNKTGVDGYSAKRIGVMGIGGQVGVRGHSTDGIGVGSTSVSGDAIRGYSTAANGVFGESLSKSGVVGGSRDSSGVYGYSERGAGVVGITGNPYDFSGYFGGCVYVDGPFMVGGGAKHAVVPHPDGSHRLLYSMESPESWFEDFGAARLVRGRARVAIARDFAAVVRTADYHVFLTAEGDSQGLYVSRKTRTGFEVREQQRGASSLRFSYRIVARRKDIPGRRMPRIKRPARPEPPPLSRRLAVRELMRVPAMPAAPRRVRTVLARSRRPR